MIESPQAALGPWQVSVVAYAYTIENGDSREILAYHWHPDTMPGFPHLHLSMAAKIGRLELQRAHLPTGLITVIDMLRLLITDFDVTPLRADWAGVLDDVQAHLGPNRS